MKKRLRKTKLDNKKSWDKRHPILTFIIGLLVVVILFLVFIGLFSTGEDKNSDSNKDNVQDKLPPLDSEVSQVGTSLTTYRVINRNNYDWHNVIITVNDYYSCWERDTLKPTESILISAVTCNQFALNNQIVESILIESDEGVARYSLR